MTYLYCATQTRKGKAQSAWLVAARSFAFVGYLPKRRWCSSTRHGHRDWLVARESVQGSSLKAGLQTVLVFFGVLLLGLALETRRYVSPVYEYTAEPAIVSRDNIGNATTVGRATPRFWKCSTAICNRQGWVVAFYGSCRVGSGCSACEKSPYARDAQRRGKLLLLAHVPGAPASIRSALAALHEPLLGTDGAVRRAVHCAVHRPGRPPTLGRSAARANRAGARAHSSGTAQACCSSSAWRWRSELPAIEARGTSRAHYWRRAH